jgi:carbonic anhydrase
VPAAVFAHPVAHPAAHCPVVSRRFGRVALTLLACAVLPAWADMPNLRPAKLRDDAGRADAPAAAASAAAAVTIDPLEQLRQRLSGRLTATKAGESTSLHEVRVVTRTEPPAPPPVARPAPRAAAKAAAVATVASPAAGHAGHAAWGYQGPAGPQTWGGLRPDFSLCGNGQRQSPIDIRGGLAVDLEPVSFQYQASRFGVIDNGHTVQANVAAGNFIQLGGKRYELVQFHFHRPSEERIDGRQFEMSVHLVHKDEQGRLAVVAVLLDKGQQPQGAVQKVWNNLPLEKGEENAARVALDLSELLPADRRYYTYMGSLTTPPCSEGVQWVVMRQPVAVSAEQIELFARIYPMNARPVQQAGGRRILQSQ